MAAAKKNEVADQGATYTLSIRYKDETGAPIDLSGHTARFVMTERSSKYAGSIIFDQDAVTTVDGWIHVVVADEDTFLWSAGTYAYRVELDNAGTLTYVVIGSFKVRSPADV